MRRDPQELASVCRGIAALALALDEIGATERTDHDLAKHIVDASGEIHTLIDYVLGTLATDTHQ